MPSPFLRLPLRPARALRRFRSRRGVASVLSMMFLILFGSLAVAMAIASKGNLQSATTHVHVLRASGAAETGLAIARARLEEAASRFVVANSQMSALFGRELWAGDFTNAGNFTILPPFSGFSESALPRSLAEALANHHAADQNVISGLTVDNPTIGNAPAGTDEGEFNLSGWVYTPAVGIEPTPSGATRPTVGFSVVYAPRSADAYNPDEFRVRIIVSGYDLGYTRNGQPVTRVIQQDFRLSKSVRRAIIAPSKVMIGKNVMIQGDMGVLFNQVANTNGQPLVLRSDFLGLDPVLDAKINALFTAIRTADTDGDCRLRVAHPTEGAALPSNNNDYNNDGRPDNAFADATKDGFVDDFDLFINHFDTNGDKRVVLSAALTAGTPAQGATAEFVNSGGNPIDDELAFLIDTANPDRNRNGVSGYGDTNRNGRWDSGELMTDLEMRGGSPVFLDQIGGYRDGVIDRKDQYAKVAGRLVFRVTKSAWQTAQGNPADSLRGPIRPARNQAPTTFGADSNTLPDMNPAMFAGAEAELRDAADGAAFAEQVARQLGISSSSLATYVETKPATTSQPRFLRLDADADLDGRPDNYATAYFEKMPFNSPNYSDWYYRPVYENMTFKNVVIPLGTNALFKNCTFIGVTRVRTTTGNSHVLWSEYGKLKLGTDNKPEADPPRIIYGDGAGETNYPTMLPNTAKPPTAMILMASTRPLDKADIPSDQTATTQGYASLPDPLIIDGKRIIDTKALSNNIRFHSCLFVGSIVSDNPSVFTQARNKIQFTGATRFASENPDNPDDPALNPDAEDLPAIARSSMMLPNYSVDVGTFNSPNTQDVKLRGAVVAGVLDVRGNAEVDGSLMLTFNPTPGQGPMRDAAGNAMGNPAGFNTTIGYFGPDDGDQESLDPRNLPTVNGVKIVGWDLDGDGIADLGPTSTPTAAQIAAGAVSVPFNGYGRIHIRFDPNMQLPSGIMLPLQFSSLPETYREGK